MSDRLNLVCVDNSEYSENGFNWYLNEHHKVDDTVGLLHVHQIPALPMAMMMSGGGMGMPLEYQKSVENSMSKARAIIEKYEIKCDELGIKNKYFIVNDSHSPGYGICHLAKEKNANSIIMGQRGLGTISRRLLGSTSDYVLHHATCPVIVIPADKCKNKKADGYEGFK